MALNSKKSSCLSIGAKNTGVRHHTYLLYVSQPGLLTSCVPKDDFELLILCRHLPSARIISVHYCVWVYMIDVCICVFVYVCVSVCMEARGQCQAFSLSLTIMLRQGLSLNLELTKWLDLLASEFGGLTVSASPGLGT